MSRFVNYDRTAALQWLDRATRRDHEEKILAAGERVAAQVAVEVGLIASMWETGTHRHVYVDRAEALRQASAVSTPQEAREALERLLQDGTVLQGGDGILRLG